MSRELAVAISNDNVGVSAIETIDAIKAAGFKNVFVQWYNMDWFPSQQDQLDYARQQGLNVIFAHLGYKNINSIWEAGPEGDSLVPGYLNDLDICRKNGIKLVIMHVNGKSVAPAYGEIGLNRFKKLAAHAQKCGISIALENTKISGYLEYIIDNIGYKNVGICFDAGHCHAHFKDNFDFEKFKNKIFAVHLHDNFGEADEHLIPFDGTADWPWVCRMLKSAEYAGPVTLELCYRNSYVNTDIVDFYKKGFSVGERLAELL